MKPERVVIDHNTEETIRESLETGCWSGMTVYPISKLTPKRVSDIIRQYGSRQMIVNGSADWGVSDPLSLVKVADVMRQDGHGDATLQDLLYKNPMAFYGGSPRWRPELNLEPVDPRTFQR
jgi:predicted metal-dependent TIM-barrel fold hydrolase